MGQHQQRSGGTHYRIGRTRFRSCHNTTPSRRRCCDRSACGGFSSTFPADRAVLVCVRLPAALLASRSERKLLANIPAVVEDGVAPVSAAVVEWAAPEGAVVTDPSASQDAPSGDGCHLCGFVVNPPIANCDPVVVCSWLIEGSFGGECGQSSGVPCLPPPKPGVLVSFGLPCQSKLITVHCAARTYSPNRCRRSG